MSIFLAPAVQRLLVQIAGAPRETNSSSCVDPCGGATLRRSASMIVTTTDGVEVEVSETLVWVRCRGVDGLPHGPWRETDKPTVEAAAAWVAARTWDEVRQGCL